MDEKTRERQLVRIEEIKGKRDDAKVEATLASLDKAIENGENVMPLIIDVMKAYISMGEIMVVFEEH